MNRRGWKTSEFWLSTLATLVGVLIASGAFADAGAVAKGLALVASALASAGYAVSRGRLKSGAPNG